MFCIHKLEQSSEIGFHSHFSNMLVNVVESGESYDWAINYQKSSDTERSLISANEKLSLHSGDYIFMSGPNTLHQTSIAKEALTFCLFGPRYDQIEHNAPKLAFRRMNDLDLQKLVYSIVDKSSKL